MIRAVRARLTTMADLMHLLGLDPLANAELSGSFPETFPEIPDNENEALALALRDRPDLAACLSEEAARQQGVGCEAGSSASLSNDQLS